MKTVPQNTIPNNFDLVLSSQNIPDTLDGLSLKVHF